MNLCDGNYIKGIFLKAYIRKVFYLILYKTISTNSTNCLKPE